MLNQQLEITYDAPAMNPEQLDVWRIIKRYQGRENAVLARNLAELTDIPERRVRDVIRHLRVDFHKPICSSTGDPAGYYIAVTPEEMKEFTDTWRRFGIKQLVMVSKLCKFPPDELIDQVRLALAEETETLT
jgi:hypothetical protein